LDQNQDGKLAKEEFAISAALRKLDLDDDETISNAELQPLRSAYGYYEDYARPQGATQPASFVSLNDADSPTKLVRQLLHKYDRSGSVLGTSGATPAMDSKLSRDELGLDLQVFQTFDADGDGQLDFDELRQLFRNPGPTLEVTVRLGQRKLDEPAVEIVPAKASGGALPVGLGQSADGVATLILGKVQIEVGAVSATESAENTRQIYAQRFKAVDADNNGYLELKEVEQRGYPKEVFELIDRDGDSKVFEKELSAFYVQQHAAMQSRVVLEVSDHGHNLFQIVDVNRDGRLTQRELARAAKRIAAWDENGDGAVTEAEIPRGYRLTLARGTLYGSRTFPAVSYDAAGQPLSRPGAGPLWFEKMDRNRDGDVSRREFLGNDDDFRQFDANADGLIDAAEAAKAK
jgi:Ca2+-binding EF-hand superfamily protein